MSHWRKFESDVLQNTKKSLLEAALKDMGLSLNYSINSIRNTWGHENVDAALVKDGKTLSLGLNFKKEGKDEQLEVTGDFYATGLNEGTFMNSLSQVYQKHNIKEKLADQRWNVDEMITNPNGEIEITASMYA